LLPLKANILVMFYFLTVTKGLPSIFQILIFCNMVGKLNWPVLQACIAAMKIFAKYWKSFHFELKFKCSME